MSVDMLSSETETVGHTAGVVWQHLASAGPASLTGLAKQIGVPRDLVMQAIGWLAREDKVVITQNGRNRTISLKF